jgi:transposase
MKRERRKFTNAFKTEVVLESLKEKQAIAQLAEKYKLYPTQIAKWKSEFLEKAQTVFGSDASETADETAKKEKLEEDLYSQIGRLKMQNEWLKKKLL